MVSCHNLWVESGRRLGWFCSRHTEQKGLWLMIDPWETSRLPSWKATGRPVPGTWKGEEELQPGKVLRVSL